MSRVVVSTHLMLDGVMQAPGPPDEGTRGIVEHSGRDGPMEIICGRSRRRNDGPCRDAFLGRRTYGDLAAFWPTQPEEYPLTMAPRRPNEMGRSSNARGLLR